MFKKKKYYDVIVGNCFLCHSYTQLVKTIGVMIDGKEVGQRICKECLDKITNYQK